MPRHYDGALADPPGGRSPGRFKEEDMLRVSALALALILSPAVALAALCPALMAEVDAALPTAELSDEDRQRVEELRAQGEELHNAGDHPGSEAALNEAKGILGI
jgi:hypothetical protein